MRIVFMGTPEFAVPSLEALVDAGYRPEAVATGPDRPRGRGQKVTPTPIKKAAKKLGIDRIIQPKSVKSDQFAAEIEQLAPDIIVVVAYKILPPQVYKHAKLGAFNLHASLLPRYRGAAPINWAVMHGESITGVTTFLLEPRVDVGNVLLQEPISIDPNDTAGEVHDRLKEVGATVVVDTVRRLEAGTIDPVPQDDARATSAPKIFSTDCKIPWERTAEEVHNHIRGLSPYPGAWTNHKDTRLKIYESRVSDQAIAEANPGVVVSTDSQLSVACGTGAVNLLRLQQPGKKRLKYQDFLRGYDLQAGDQLG